MDYFNTKRTMSGKGKRQTDRIAYLIVGILIALLWGLRALF